MTALLFAAIVAILAHQPTLNMTAIPGPVYLVERGGSVTVRTETRGWTDCALTTGGGKPDSWVVLRIVYSNPDTLEHEALHGADCADNGRMDGSLLPYPTTWPDAAHEWVAWALTHRDEASEIMGSVK